MRILTLLLVLASAASFHTGRQMHEQKQFLKNGEAFTVDIERPESDNAYEANTPVQVKGQAGIGLQDPDVAFIYLIDSSGSTSDSDDYDGICKTVLTCIQAFFAELHETVDPTLAAVINFDDDARIDLNWTDSNDGIEAAFKNETSNGGTNCEAALTKALELLNDEANTANHTHVILATDGYCNEGSNSTVDWEEATQAAAEALRVAGAIVHTVAVGGGTFCDNDPNSYNHLDTIPQNGGSCRSVDDPTDLPDAIDELIGVSLENLEIKVDEGNYTAINNYTTINTTGSVLPQEGVGSIEANFYSEVPGVAPGKHTICVRATANTTVGGWSQTEDCHDFMAVKETGLEAWQKFLLVVFLLGLTGFVVFAIKNKAAFLRHNEDGPANLEMQVEPPTRSGEGPAVV